MIENDIPGVVQIRRYIQDFRPDGLRRWRFLYLDCSVSSNHSDHSSVDLIIQAEYSREPELNYVVELKMYGVHELRFPEMRRWFGFDAYVIENVRDHQWEGVGYRVAECEEGRRFLCLCRSVAFTKLIRTEPGGADQVLWDATISE